MSPYEFLMAALLVALHFEVTALNPETTTTESKVRQSIGGLIIIGAFLAYWLRS